MKRLKKILFMAIILLVAGSSMMYAGGAKDSSSGSSGGSSSGGSSSSSSSNWDISQSSINSTWSNDYRDYANAISNGGFPGGTPEDLNHALKDSIAAGDKQARNIISNYMNYKRSYTETTGIEPSYSSDGGTSFWQGFSEFCTQCESEYNSFSVEYAVMEKIQGSIFLTSTIKQKLTDGISERIADRKAELARQVIETQKNTESTITQSQTSLSKSAGDPVRVTNGEYIQQETDIETGGAHQFAVQRFYETSEKITGSVGYGWATNLDMRILLGIDFEARKIADKYYETSTYIADARKQFIETMKEEYSVTSIETAEAECKERLDKLEKIFLNIYGTKLRVDWLHGAGSNSPHASRIKAIYDKVTEVYVKAEKQTADLISVVEQLPRDMEFLDDLQRQYEETYEKWLYYEDRAIRSEARAEKNAPAVFMGTPASYYETSLETLTLIDENGTPHLFVQDSDNEILWKPIRKEEFALLYVETQNDGSYICAKKDGTKIYFAENGLVEKTVDRNGNAIRFERNDGNKITSVTSSLDERLEIFWSGDFIAKIQNANDKTHCVMYEYEGSKLVSVTDTDGDKVKYNYDENKMLSSLTKSDGSMMRFRHLLQDSEGRFLTTETVNEEGFSEKFEYDYENKITVYTDHAGVATVYWYDDNYKITKEKFSDGTIKEYAYDEETGNCVSETVNGHTTYFEYDDAGNKTLARYEDGSTETWRYDKYGFVTERRDRDGITEFFERDANGNLLSYRKGNAAAERAVYNSKGLVTSISNSVDGSVAYYEYDGRGNLTRIHKNNSVKEYVYDGRNRVVSFSVDGKQISQYSYTPKTTTIESYSGLRQVYEYNSRKDLISISETDTVTGEKRVTEYEYDRRHLPVAVYSGDGISRKLIAEYRYDEAGKLKGVMYRGYEKDSETWITLYGYIDENGIPLEEIRTVENFKIAHIAAAATPFAEMDLEFLKMQAAEKYTARYEKTITATGTLVSFIDGLGRKTSSEYDLWARPVSTTNPLGEKSKLLFSAAGRLQKEQSAHGGFYEYRYDAYTGNVTQSGEQDAPMVSATYNPDGTVASVTDRLGETTSYSYDSERRVKEIKNANGIFSYEYDTLGRIVRNAVSEKTGNIIFVNYSYGKDGRTVTENRGGLYFTQYFLDAWGNVAKTKNGEGDTRLYSYNSEGKISCATDGYGNETKYFYNAIRKISGIEYADGSTKNYKYDHIGNVTEISDGAGIFWRGSYDSGGRLVSDWKRGGTENEYVYDTLDRIVEMKVGGETVERYEYGERGKTTAVTDAKGGKYVYTRDDFGRMTGEQNRIGVTQEFRYDAEGNMVSKTDFGGAEISIERFGGGAEKKINYFDGTKDIFTYNATGAIIKSSNENATLRYEYDAGGNLARQTDTASGEVTTYGYDAAGRRTAMRSGNREISYRYGKNGETLSVIDLRQRLSVNFEYDKLTRETKRTFGNGVQQRTFYDAGGRICAIAEYDSVGNLTRGEGYAYGDDGRRSATVNESGEVTRYEYDRLGRVTAVHYPDSRGLAEAHRLEAERNGAHYQGHNVTARNGTLSRAELEQLSRLMDMMQFSLGNRLGTTQEVRSERYAYDENGNRVSKTTAYGTVEYEYDAENRLVSSGSNKTAAITYAYDANGNLLGESGSHRTAGYVYNAQNRMTRSTVYDTVARTRADTVYAYDAFGRRTLTQDDGGTATRTIYDGFGFDVIRESGAFESGALTDMYDEGAGYVAGRTGEANGGRYRLLDAGGAARAVTNDRLSGGTGRAALRGDTDAAGGVTGTARRFTGERLPLYSGGYAVGVGVDGAAMYLGTDVMGSVRSVTDGYGAVESLRGYDIFGTPYDVSAGGSDFSGAFAGASAGGSAFAGGVAYGYAGKQYDAVTGMYDYGFRDYSPASARFTTPDPIRDGRNWFSYVNNDPVNYVDLWGLMASEPKQGNGSQPVPQPIQAAGASLIAIGEKSPSLFNQLQWTSETFGKNFARNACAATSLLNIISDIYTEETGKQMTVTQAETALDVAIKKEAIDRENALIGNWQKAAESITKSLGLTGKVVYDEKHPDYMIYALNKDYDPSTVEHFVSVNINEATYFDPYDGQEKSIVKDINAVVIDSSQLNINLQEGRPFRGINYYKE